VPTFVAGFLEPPDAGEVLSKFSIDTNLLPFYAGEEHVAGDPEDAICLRRRRGSASTASPHHCVDSHCIGSLTSPTP
jgi:hypothetical protein